MPATDSWQERPYTVVDHAFENHIGDGWVKAVLNEFNLKVEELDNLSAIPSLNDHAIHELLPNSLVRFRCMIQDHFNNEIFLQDCVLTNAKTGTKIHRTSYFRDVIDCPNGYEVEQKPSAFGTRQVFYCVSVPAECNWTKQGWKDAGSSKLNRSKPSNLNSSKRKRDDDDNEMEVSRTDDLPREDVSDENKKSKLNHQGSSQADQQSTSEVVFNKNHPLPDESGPVCLVKVYDESANFKINDIYEFIGILSVDPTLCSIYDSNDDDEMSHDNVEETKAHHPPASLVPRLHIVALKRMPHVNPFVCGSTAGYFEAELQNDAPSIRSSLLSILEKALFGDALAAEYLLLHLMARISSRHAGLALGKFSLNISGIPPGSNYPFVLCSFLKELVTKMFYFPMSIDKFNSGRFVPIKNYNTNRLDTGMLQLSDGTHLFIDETTLAPGNLSADGVKNIKALKDLVAFQKVEYNFKFSEVSFESDLGVLVLSEGKSILPCDCQIEIKPRTAIPDDAKPHFSLFCLTTPSEILDKCRCYITAAEFVDYNLNDEISKAIQEDFVAARRQNSEVSADDLHAWLVLARLMSVSFGCKNLVQQKWDRVKALETQRKARATATTHTNGH